MMCDRIQNGFYKNVINPLREAIAQGDLALAEPSANVPPRAGGCRKAKTR